MSLAEIQEDMKHTRIPSSESPSPAKTSVTASETEPDTPLRPDKEAANGLAESIALLKRPAQEIAPEPDKRRKRARPAERTTTVRVTHTRAY